MPNAVLHLPALCEGYLKAKQSVIRAGYEDEICWQVSRRSEEITEPVFLREVSWVILSAGLSYHAVHSVFPKLSDAFLNWNSAAEISLHQEECLESALQHFRNMPKIRAILEIASITAEVGIGLMASRITDGDFVYLETLPYLGPATSRHLVKNLGGAHVAKPDRHLKRIASAFSYSDVDLMCRDIANNVGDEVPEVDLVLWRYATLEKDYIDRLHEPLRRFSYP